MVDVLDVLTRITTQTCCKAPVHYKGHIYKCSAELHVHPNFYDSVDNYAPLETAIKQLIKVN